MLHAKGPQYMIDLDEVFKDLRQKQKNGQEIYIAGLFDKIVESIPFEINKTEKNIVYRKINKYFKQDKDIAILDFGCGKGQLVFYLYALGYKKVFGVDITSQDENIRFLKEMGIVENLFLQYDGQSLPFQDESFNMVISEQVLEHVFDIDGYYYETARVLKKGGVAYLSFPQRLIPFDSHSRTWFVHYFPKRIRRFIFKSINKDPDYYDRILNLKTARYHKKIASRYFSHITDETPERLLLFDDGSLANYEGNVFLRKMLDKMIKMRFIGPILLPILSKISNLDLGLIK